MTQIFKRMYECGTEINIGTELYASVPVRIVRECDPVRPAQNSSGHPARMEIFCDTVFALRKYRVDSITFKRGDIADLKLAKVTRENLAEMKHTDLIDMPSSFVNVKSKNSSKVCLAYTSFSDAKKRTEVMNARFIKRVKEFNKANGTAVFVDLAPFEQCPR